MTEDLSVEASLKKFEETWQLWLKNPDRVDVAKQSIEKIIRLAHLDGRLLTIKESQQRMHELDKTVDRLAAAATELQKSVEPKLLAEIRFVDEETGKTGPKEIM